MSNRARVDELTRRRGELCHWCRKATLRNPAGERMSLGPSYATLEHILPKERRGRTTIENTRLACVRCNTGRAAAGHCIGALRCAQAVLGKEASQGQIARWLLPRIIKKATGRQASVTLADRIGTHSDEFIFPADTPAKRVWNIAALARGSGSTSRSGG